MSRKIIYLSLSFFTVLLLHLFYSINKGVAIAKQWTGMKNINWLQIYFRNSDYMLGASYALAVSFSIYAIIKFLEMRQTGVSGMAGGITLTGMLYAGGCFLVGCCGSPMLAIYIGLFGASFLGFTKPLIFGFTLISVIIGYYWIERKCRASGLCCTTDQNSQGKIENVG